MHVPKRERERMQLPNGAWSCLNPSSSISPSPQDWGHVHMPTWHGFQTTRLEFTLAGHVGSGSPCSATALWGRRLSS